VAGTSTGAVSWVFYEGDFLLPLTTAVDISTPGSYATIASLTAGSIAAGTEVSSFYYHTLGPDVSGDVFSGSITFSAPILGVEALIPNLIATNGRPGTTYFSTNHAQGFEFGQQIDSLTISPNRLTLTFLNETFGAADDLRIITSTVPEPSSLVLLSTGFVALVSRYRRRSTRKVSNP
jgi:hypothetical protein